MASLASTTESLACSRGSLEQAVKRGSESVIMTRRVWRTRIHGMGEGSLLFGSARFPRFLRTLRPPRSREALRRLYARIRRQTGALRRSVLEPRAARAIHEYFETHVASLERATRLEEKAERLEEDGIPSESVRNRAHRARRGVVAGLAALRAS